MRKTYPGHETITDCRIIYNIHTSHENQMELLRLTGDRYRTMYFENMIDDSDEELELEDFISRIDENLIVKERHDSGFSFPKMADKSGNTHYDIDGAIKYCHKAYDGSMVLDVFTVGVVDPEALCVAIQTVCPDSKVYYMADGYDGSMYRTNDKTRGIFFPLDYNFGYKKDDEFRNGTSDDIDDACELLSTIGFSGEHTEQALLDFVANYPIEDEWDSVWFNKLEIV